MAGFTVWPNWLWRWKRGGDDIRCPKCWRCQIETHDGVTGCLACGWESKNFLARAAGQETRCIQCSHVWENEGELKCPRCRSEQLVLVADEQNI